VFAVMARNATSPADYFSLPPDRVLVLGAKLTV
jgi:K+ transporter